ncbi:MAG: phage head morphogenesis protein [Rhodanobacteraceae bacterium]
MKTLLMTPARKARNRLAGIPKDRVLRAVRANAGIQAWYRKRLDAAIEQMQASLVFWIKAQYRAAGLADGVAEDAADGGPVAHMRKELRKLTARWQDSFDKMAQTLSAEFAERVKVNSDASLAGKLRERGLPTVKFTMTDEMRNAYQAVAGEQVGLIKSIASEHLTDVEGIVMRSVSRGRDLESVAKELQARYGVTKRRAALIARDQNNKATSALQSVRQRQLGIAEGIWKHSHGGKHPRPSHVKANGQKFDLSKGMYLDGKWVMPGEEINCRCTWSPVIPGLD